MFIPPSKYWFSSVNNLSHGKQLCVNHPRTLSRTAAHANSQLILDKNSIEINILRWDCISQLVVRHFVWFQTKYSLLDERDIGLVHRFIFVSYISFCNQAFLETMFSWKLHQVQLKQKSNKNRNWKVHLWSKDRSRQKRRRRKVVSQKYRTNKSFI